MLENGIIPVIPYLSFLWFYRGDIFIGCFAGLGILNTLHDLELGVLRDTFFHADFSGVSFYFPPFVGQYGKDGCFDFEILVLFGERDDIFIHRSGAYSADEFGTRILAFEHRFLVKLIFVRDIFEAVSGLVVEECLNFLRVRLVGIVELVEDSGNGVVPVELV